MKLSNEQKRENKRQRMLDRYRSMSITKVRNEVAKTFQKLVRMQAADKNGVVACVTCGRKHKWNSGLIDAGHFYSRRHLGTLLHPRNVAPQCVHCNKYKDGELIEYTFWMQRNYTQEELDELKRLKKAGCKRTKWELCDLRMEYMDKIAIEKRRLNG